MELLELFILGILALAGGIDGLRPVNRFTRNHARGKAYCLEN